MSEEDIPQEIVRVHKRVDRIETDVHALRKGQDELQHELTDIGNSMSSQHNELRDILRDRSTTTLEDIVKIMQAVVLGGAIIASVVGGIVYISGNANSVQVALLQEKMRHLSSAFSWKVVVKPGPSQ